MQDFCAAQYMLIFLIYNEIFKYLKIGPIDNLNNCSHYGISYSI